MANDDSRYLEAFPSFLRTLSEDALGLARILSAQTVAEPVRRAIAGGINYLFKSLDLVPDGIDDIGYLDDAFVLRVAAAEAVAAGGAGSADEQSTLARLAGEAKLVEAFLAADYPRLVAYVADLKKGAARGITVDDVIAKPLVCADLVSNVEQFAKSFVVPSFAREEKTLVKLRAFLGSRLPAAK